MARYAVGDTIKVAFSIKDADAGDLFDPDDVVVVIKKGDGSTLHWSFTAGDVRKIDVGKYAFNLTFDRAGYWQYQIDATGPSSRIRQRAFNVDAALT